ncbi:hypothetical protein KIW84_070121 [Lathyrus oleraceus]|uniref:Uncharacterized protein n=1 Tax=Pisum sativum TaxID=3888 RepID=A0A9D4VGX2_PEA|nr:hypothetical protein KIW84_070121 [Pisum sativum]
MEDNKADESQRSSGVSSDKLAIRNLLNLDQSRSKNVSLERRWSLELGSKLLVDESSSLLVKISGKRFVEWWLWRKTVVGSFPGGDREFKVLGLMLVYQENFQNVST